MVAQTIINNQPKIRPKWSKGECIDCKNYKDCIEHNLTSDAGCLQFEVETMVAISKKIGRNQPCSYKEVYNVSKTGKAWTAGIIDGEGCIGVYYNRHKKMKKHILIFTVNATDARMINKLKEYWGGYVRLQDVSKNGILNRRPQWHWRMYGKEAAKVLKLLLPYLVIKKEQAELGIEFAQTLTSSRLRPYEKLPDSVMVHRVKIEKELKRLKRA